MLMGFFVQIVHVLDVYIFVCMQISTTCFLPYFETDRNQIKIRESSSKT